MVKNELLKSQLFYLISIVSMIYVSMYIQAFFLARLSFPFFHIDLTSIIVSYMCLEQDIVLAAFLAFVAGLLFQTLSSSSGTFFVFYFILMLVFSSTLKRFFVIKSTGTISLVFVFIFLFKYILFFVGLPNHAQIGVLPMLGAYWEEYLSTCIVSLLCYKFLARFDEIFLLPGTLKNGKSYGG